MPGADPRAAARALQREVLPAGHGVVSGTGGYGSGGLGRHLAELVEALRDTASLTAYLTPTPRPDDVNGVGIAVTQPALVGHVMKVPPLRGSLARHAQIGNVVFDRLAARRIPEGGEHLLSFNGAGTAQIRRARILGYASTNVMSANCHYAHLSRQHDTAWKQYPIERPWSAHLLERNLAEYAAADLVYVSSQYSWDTFVAEGFPPERLRMFPLTAHDRFQHREASPASPTFNVVYVGALSVDKGVPLLIESFGRLGFDDLRLELVGGFGTRPMRRLIQAACAADSRISAAPGDPLPHLIGAGVYVHPSFAEGAPYAPAEARACGVPIIATVDSAVPASEPECVVVPTGDPRALTDAIEAAYLAGSASQRAPMAATPAAVPEGTPGT